MAKRHRFLTWFLIWFLVWSVLITAGLVFAIKAYEWRAFKINEIDARRVRLLEKNPPVEQIIAMERARATAELEYFFYFLFALIPLSYLLVALILIFLSKARNGAFGMEGSGVREHSINDDELRAKVRQHFAKKGER